MKKSAKITKNIAMLQRLKHKQNPPVSPVVVSKQGEDSIWNIMPGTLEKDHTGSHSAESPCKTIREE